MGRTVEYKVIQSQFTVETARRVEIPMDDWYTFKNIALAEETILNDLALDGWRLDHVDNGRLYLVREKPLHNKLWNESQVFVTKAECEL